MSSNRLKNKKIKVAFVICWFGKLPSYLPIWLKSCKWNPNYTFLLLTDNKPNYPFPDNVRYIPYTKVRFLDKVKASLKVSPNLIGSYRLCDFRPMYGVILRDELKDYDFWGYCDVDLVFGDISCYVGSDILSSYDTVFNGGHFTLFHNNVEMNNLYRQKGALFDYRAVSTKNATFAFDETTGIQRIARINHVNALFGVPYVEADSRYSQLRSRMERTNPNIQAYYWEDGKLYRVKYENKYIWYQNLAYIHLQKRKIHILDENVAQSNSFWITPQGFISKEKKGMPSIDDICKYNPYLGKDILEIEEKQYKKLKINSLLNRSLFQVYVRVRQQLAGINAGDGASEEREWIKF